MKTTILFFIFILSISVYSQSYNFGIQIKSSVLYTQQYSDGEYDKFVEFYPLSVYFANKFKINEAYEIELSPGYLFAGDNFSGFEILLYIKRYFGNVFVGLGPTLHYNIGCDYGTSIQEYSPNKTFINASVVSGIKLGTNISLLVNYILPLSKDFGYSSVFSYPDAFVVKYERKLFYIIQMGIEFNF